MDDYFIFWIWFDVGLFENIALGNVYAQDEDDWDIANKTFTFADDDTKNYFRLASGDTGKFWYFNFC